MGAPLNAGRKPEWGGFNMSMLALQIDPEAWWLAHLWALYRERMLANVEGRPQRSASEGFIGEEGGA